MHIFKTANVLLKTRLKQVLGSLPLFFAFPAPSLDSRHYQFPVKAPLSSCPKNQEKEGKYRYCSNRCGSVCCTIPTRLEFQGDFRGRPSSASARRIRRSPRSRIASSNPHFAPEMF